MVGKPEAIGATAWPSHYSRIARSKSNPQSQSYVPQADLLEPIRVSGSVRDFD